MAGRERSIDHDGEPAATARLVALGLPGRRGGWVPEQPDEVRADQVTVGALARAAVADRVPVWARGWLQVVSPGAVLTAAVIVVALVIVGVSLWRQHEAAGSAAYSSPVASQSSGTMPVGPTATPTPDLAGADPGGSVVVDVGGRVRKPGLVTLPQGARVADAIAAAGGLVRAREASSINLAARVSDGQMLVVGMKAAGPSGSPPALAGGDAGATGDPATDGGSGAPISLSTASEADLETLPGVGPVTAQKIIDWRTAHGGFTAIGQLQEVSGIGPATYAELAPLVTP